MASYWTWVMRGDSATIVEDSYLDGIVPGRVVDLMVARNVAAIGLCDRCPVCSHAHVIEHDTNRKLCPVLYHDVFAPRWRVEDLV